MTSYTKWNRDAYIERVGGPASRPAPGARVPGRRGGAVTPAGSASAANTARMIPRARPDPAPPGQLPPDRRGEPVQAQAPDPAQVPGAPDPSS